VPSYRSENSKASVKYLLALPHFLFSKMHSFYTLKFLKLCFVLHLIKGIAIPLQAWTGPEGSRRLRLPDFKTVDT